jgi:hypothetical protein
MKPNVLAWLPFITPVATLIVVIVGVLFSNRHVDVRVSDLHKYLDARFTSVDQRFGHMEKYMEARFTGVDQRIGNIEKYMETRFTSADQIFQDRLRRVEEVVDARLSRIEHELRLR